MDKGYYNAYRIRRRYLHVAKLSLSRPHALREAGVDLFTATPRR